MIDSEYRSSAPLLTKSWPLLSVFEVSVREEDLDKVLNDEQIFPKVIRLFALDFYA